MAELRLENQIRVTTQHGPCQVELVVGDITKLPLQDKVDIVMVSAFPGDYIPSAGTLIGALSRNLGVSVGRLSMHKDMDLRRHFHCWLSKPLPEHVPYKRVVCFERSPDFHHCETYLRIERDYKIPHSEVSKIMVHPAHLVGDMFRGLTPVFSNQDSTMITPLLATGMQHFSHTVMMKSMVDAACNWMKAGLPLRCLKIALFTDNHNRIPEGMKDLFILFDGLKHKWEKKGASLKVSSVQYDIYLSYSLHDQEKVNIIKVILAKRYKSLKVFSEKQELWNEQAWQEAMYEKMTSCKRIVALLSPSYLECADCMEQFNIALCCTRLQSLILLTPVYVETVPSMPAYMQLVQYIDCRGLSPPEEPVENRLGKACAAITQSLTDHDNQDHPQSQGLTYDVFISYSHKSPEEAEQFLHILQTQSPSTKVFFDRSGLVAGKSWQQTLYSVLDRVRCVVAFVTSSYLTSAVCQEEYNIALARAVSKEEDILFLPVCVDPELQEISVLFSGVKLLDGRGEAFSALAPELCAEVVTWLRTGVIKYPCTQRVMDIGAISEESRQVDVQNTYTVVKHTLECLVKKSVSPADPAAVVGEEKSQGWTGCDIHFCYSQNDTRLAAVLSQMISQIVPDVSFSFGAGSPQDRLQKLDTARRVVMFVCPAFLQSPHLVDELHMALCRHRVATKGPLVYAVQSGPLDPHPVFLHLLPYDVCLQDDVWERLGKKTELLGNHRTVVVRGELQGSYGCSRNEIVALRKASLELAEDVLRKRSGEKSPPDVHNMNLVNVLYLERHRKSEQDVTIPISEALLEHKPLTTVTAQNTKVGLKMSPENGSNQNVKVQMAPENCSDQNTEVQMALENGSDQNTKVQMAPENHSNLRTCEDESTTRAKSVNNGRKTAESGVPVETTTVVGNSGEGATVRNSPKRRGSNACILF